MDKMWVEGEWAEKPDKEHTDGIKISRYVYVGS